MGRKRVCQVCRALLYDAGPCPYCLLRENACKHMRNRAVLEAQAEYIAQQGKHKPRKKSEKAAMPGAALERCPECQHKTLIVENGCYQCLNPQCLYSKCSMA